MSIFNFSQYIAKYIFAKFLLPVAVLAGLFIYFLSFLQHIFQIVSENYAWILGWFF